MCVCVCVACVCVRACAPVCNVRVQTPKIQQLVTLTMIASLNFSHRRTPPLSPSLASTHLWRVPIVIKFGHVSTCILQQIATLPVAIKSGPVQRGAAIGGGRVQYICPCLDQHLCTYWCMYTCMYVCAHVCACAHGRTGVHLSAYAHTKPQTPAHTHRTSTDIYDTRV